MPFYKMLKVEGCLMQNLNNMYKSRKEEEANINISLLPDTFMADLVISPILKLVIGTLSSTLIEEVRSTWGVDEELEKLTRTLKLIQDVLADAEERQTKERSVKNWLGQIKDVAYDADDVLDEFSYEALQWKVEGRAETSERKQVCNFLPSCIRLNQVPFRRDIARRIKVINEKLDGISRDRNSLQLLTEGASGGRNRDIERPQTSSLMTIPELHVLGREEDRENIKNLLMSDENESIVSIVGMGGIGKTTLAQLIYNDTNVKAHFEPRAWVCVSEDSDVKNITKEIIESVTGTKCDISGVDPLQRQLEDILSGKRFLLVLDDVWHDKRDDWERIRAPFISGAKGSKTIVTTRSDVVSNAMGSRLLYRLGILNNDLCLSLFKRWAFADGNSNDYPELMDIGKELVKKCNGLPLAAKALGGLLCTTRDERTWRRVLGSEIWELQKDDINIMPALAVSYHHLPTHLKQCFAYCAVFPKDYEFEKDTLVLFWMAQGFIVPEKGMSLEEVGSEYFDNLLLRSFFQQYKIRKRRGVQIYKMHDLMHDLAQSISSDECFRIEYEKPFDAAKRDHRHLLICVNHNERPAVLEEFYKSKGLRSFIVISLSAFSMFTILDFRYSDFFMKMRCLRILVLRFRDVKEFPDSFHMLKHLRYLDLSCSLIRKLPESVCSCYNLQTLKLDKCGSLRQLPKETSKLINLRHLNLDKSENLQSMPLEFGRLTCLQTLSKFVVGEESGSSIGELKKLTELKGKITISHLENVANAKEAEKDVLKNTPYIDELTLEWKPHRQEDEASIQRSEKVLEALQPHTNIKILTIWRYQGSMIPSWMEHTMVPNLVTLKLICLGRCKLLPPLGQLRKLKHLEIIGMVGVKRIDREFCGGREIEAFPSLEYLHMEYMKHLEEWLEVDEGDFPCFQHLDISFCHELTNLPITFSTLEKLTILDCKKLTFLPKLPSLRDLNLEDCSGMLLRSVLHLTSLSTLGIRNFGDLMSLPQGLLQSLVQLENLTISSCGELVSLLEEDGLLQDKGLPSNLTSLMISDCINLKSLSKGLRNLTSLKRLEIESCDNLLSLPEEGLPSTLQHLSIVQCYKLGERCRKEEGQDWDKISYIPHIEIDNVKIS